MSPSRVHLLKALICAAMLCAIVCFFGKDAFPGTSSLVVVLWASLVAAGLIAVIMLSTLIASNFNLWNLRHGAIDPAWLWFDHNPPGLGTGKKVHIAGDDK